MTIYNAQYNNLFSYENRFLQSTKESVGLLGLKPNIACISVLERRHHFVLAVLVNSHFLTLAAATMTKGQPVIEVFM